MKIGKVTFPLEDGIGRALLVADNTTIIQKYKDKMLAQSNYREFKILIMPSSGGIELATGELCRVLIVDDEILIRQGIKHYINWEKEGFSIVGEASNGQEALELIEITNPHLIITDIVMPIMDGEELTRIVKERYPKIEIIILSSFGDFDYVRSTFQNGVIDYILKPKLDAGELLMALKSAARRIPSFQPVKNQLDVNLSIGQIINKLISGYEVNFDTKSISETFPNSYYSLLGVDVKNHPTNDMVEFPKYITGKIVSELQLNISQVVHYSFNVEQNLIVFILNYRKGDRDDVFKFAHKLAETIQDVGFAMSEAFADFSQIGNIYKCSLLKLLNYRFYFPELPLLMEKVLPKPLPKCENFNLDRFTGDFKQKHFDAAFRYLKDHVTKLSGCYTTDVFEYKAFFGNIIFNITIFLTNMEYDVKVLEKSKYSYFKSIDKALTFKEVVQLLDCFIEEVKNCIFSMENQPENANMKKLMEYIKAHYAEPLTLKSVAKHFHFNPSYLSSYFSAHNNERFIEYLNKIRVEEASRLLIMGTATISEISGMVGYSDHSYFCKVFKKIKRVSPSQYKRTQYL
ncbi:response regulator transcription factor [Neobacillus massiliamazoniensis]|uniref:Two-component response regulator n=1 Tax=Neobacillus massiliamazoniensis TaxID=1499688 RepID=A0A0U1NW53_9BACI|nr:two-component response regulator [Neobacillus massiliamazoniensis]